MVHVYPLMEAGASATDNKHMRNAYKTAIYNITKNNKRVFSVLADSATAEYDLIRREMPDRIVDCGIAEANAIGVAAGLASCDYIPIVYGLGTFLAYRAFEFIRDDIALQKRNVKIVGLGGGVGYNNAGPTHHTTEDIAVMTSLPNMSVVSPATPNEVAPVLSMAVEHDGPVYIRMGKAFEDELFEQPHFTEFGKAQIVKSGIDITIISTGAVLADVMVACDELSAKGYEPEVINITTIKPIDKATITQSALKTGRLLVVEEHNSYGGLGSIISTLIVESDICPRYSRIGFNDIFCEEYGYRREIKHSYGISANAILIKALDLINSH